MATYQENLSPAQLQEKLRLTGDFLQLSRCHPYAMPAFNFVVNCHANLAKIKVSVVDTGIITFEPIKPTTAKDIVLSSAVHGNETAPIEICNNLIKQLLLGQLQLEHRVLFIFGNPPSINIAQRFVEENLNRLFSGGHSQDQGQGAGLINQERHRALLLENTVKQFFEQGQGERFHYDLHTAIRGSKNDKFAVYPFRHHKPWVTSQLQFLLACGINTILFSHAPTTTFSYFSSNEFDAHAFTVELGKVKPFGENNMANFIEVTKCLTALIATPDLTLGVYNKADFNFFEINQVIDRESENFTFHFADDVENFTHFPIGTVIATDGDKQIKTHKQGEAIIFPNAHVAIGQRALLTVVPVEINPQ